MSKLILQMVLGIREGIGGCVLDMGKTMGRVWRLETAENNEFLKSVKIFWTFLEAKKCLNGASGRSREDGESSRDEYDRVEKGQN